ncbi:MAG: hypothetical protein ACK5OB_06870 [Pirellula sp.]|jgi:hypothetical protein
MVSSNDEKSEEATPHRWWVHWFDGLPEVIGAISLSAYVLGMVGFFVVGVHALCTPATEGKLGRGFNILIYISMLVILAIFNAIACGICLLCFRHHKGFFGIFLRLHIPLLFVALICGFLIEFFASGW